MKRTEAMGRIVAAGCAALIAMPAAAAPVVYELDPLHTFPSIEFSHMDISIWRALARRTPALRCRNRRAAIDQFRTATAVANQGKNDEVPVSGL